MILPSLDDVLSELQLLPAIEPISVLDYCAEAVLLRTRYLNRDCVTKVRLPKKYRIEQLDNTIRQRRTIQEAKLIYSARQAGANTPIILDLDIYNHSFTMLFIDGVPLRKIVDENLFEYIPLFHSLGKQLGLLHQAGIIHGDLTTSNVIIEEQTKLAYFIDFGLGRFSSTIEDHATDLLVLKRTLESTHFHAWKVSWDAFLKSYLAHYPKAKSVIKRLERIEQRGRHARRKEI